MKKLTRSKTDRMLTGVAGGVSEYLGIDSRIIRIIFIILAFFHGIGLLAYLILLVLMPNTQETTGPFDGMFNQYKSKEQSTTKNNDKRKNLKDVQEFDHK
ncbi:PspC domain-containing protein [Apilactobacillus micheneri]|uniref:PspC domain-containing protein n=1 Tax=Apilactobacillus micheneri TaxID=1899430 RepID=A0A2S2JLY8_9LACO|nr:PspC domain-containing protein [Apilactobacillus micheneri]TPR39252.1 PspC domain-containing protein [Apilactobacillus micheneri]TPR41368.1 PspC domain-containing protein [Apilactobacillus micheneri]TPR43226.1 PspC domain-containing protein [Apilactobacillus micheneri]TPR44010.1 PspC domain-containing protein [Apilactobacillus micheneri]TPR44474.1 PspC domain-containing protein [Apilactobacillus micheneri]